MIAGILLAWMIVLILGLAANVKEKGAPEFSDGVILVCVLVSIAEAICSFF